MTCLVAVAAPIGGGKSALVKGLAKALDGASTIHFDDYEVATQKSPAELARWIADGAEFNSLRAPGFAEALRALKRGESVADPGSGEPVRPGEFVVLEMPLGRAYAATAELIDILVWVNTPLDVALARNIRAMAAEAATPDDAQDFLRWLDAYLGQYPDQLRTILQLQKIRVAPAADIVLDGLQAPEYLVAEALRAIAIRRAPD
jgi:uridine kinase